MKYFTMTGSLNDEMLHKFVAFFNEHRDEPCTIIFNSRGGFTSVAETMGLMIGQMTDVTLLIHGVYSAAFELCYKVKCKKILSKYATGMWHLGRLEGTIGIDSKFYYDEELNNERNFPLEKRLGEKMAKTVMTPVEFKKYKKREEVWFDAKRMRDIFPDAKVLK